MSNLETDDFIKEIYKVKEKLDRLEAGIHANMQATERIEIDMMFLKTELEFQEGFRYDSRS